MKIAGALTLVVGILVGIVLCLLPTHQHLLGSDIDCGVPLVGMLGYDDTGYSDSNALYQQCQRDSQVRVFLGGVIGAGALAGGLTMVLAGPSAEERERAKYEQWKRFQQQSQQPPHW